MIIQVKNMYITVILLSFFACVSVNSNAQQKIKEPNAKLHTLVIFFDGLRPDYITPETMPNVYAFSQRASYGKQHHSVIPTVTRVNASSYATGSYPSTHGLMGNTIYFPEVDPKKGLNTGDANELNRVVVATNGHLLTAVSLGEILAHNGEKMMVFSSGSTGSTLLQNHTFSGGPTINPDMIAPDSFKTALIQAIGPLPANGKTKEAQNKWVTDAILYYAIQPDGPMVSSIWYTDPDHTAHADGIGSPTAMASIKVADEQFGRIIADLQQKGLTDQFNIIITADHGFITHAGQNSVTEFLIKEGLKKEKESEDVVVAEGAIYVVNHDEKKIRAIVAKLQAQPWVGSVFTKAIKPGDTKGWVEGTVSFDAIHWNHPQRAADILVDYNWNDDKNGAGYPGTGFSRGVAGHGSFSPYEVHIALLAAGPSFKKSLRSEWPTSNVDIVPTILHIHHLAIPALMDGRVLYELLQEKTTQSLPTVKKDTIIATVDANGNRYQLQVFRTRMGKYSYLDYTKVTRNGTTGKLTSQRSSSGKPAITTR